MATKEELFTNIKKSPERGIAQLKEAIDWAKQNGFFDGERGVKLRNQLWFAEHEVCASSITTKYYARKLEEIV